jgi:hypothetical protein
MIEANEERARALARRMLDSTNFYSAEKRTEPKAGRLEAT